MIAKCLKILVLFLLAAAGASAQSDSTISLVISVNQNILVSISDSKLYFGKNDSGYIRVNYVPGKLILKKNDIKKIISNQVDSVSLVFDYYEYCRGKQNIYNYNIELKRKWFDFSFIVLRIYNLDKGRFKKIFFPLPGCNYTYEMDFPGFSVDRVRKG